MAEPYKVTITSVFEIDGTGLDMDKVEAALKESTKRHLSSQEMYVEHRTGEAQVYVMAAPAPKTR